MTRSLNLADIQGNIVRSYGAYGFTKARYFFLHIDEAEAGRTFVESIRLNITTAQRWALGSETKKNSEDYIPRPESTLNIAFTFSGLKALGLPARTLQGMPSEFVQGMANRASVLGDIKESAPENWDPIWQMALKADHREAVHIWVSIYARMNPDETAVAVLEEKTEWLRELCISNGGVRLLKGHASEEKDFQEAGALLSEGLNGKKVATGKEHFGYRDGLGNPVFEGQYAPEVEKVAVVGRGKIMPDQSWKPLAPGEFIFGHADESQALPITSRPWELMLNGTFLVYRKLHQNVASFNNYIDRVTDEYVQAMEVSKEEAISTIKAKMVGRWPDGVPLMAASTYTAWLAFQKRWKGKEQSNEYRMALMDFKYRDDIEGYKCPVSAHIRRTNTRDILDPQITSKNPRDLAGSAINKRRRILRRGLPYGKSDPNSLDNDEHGIIFIAICTDIFRQFEFVQQQWLHYGLDFNVGNDTCPLVGNHDQDSKFVIASDPREGKPPFICHSMPQFVTIRGGDYFFMPSMTALQMITMGIVDPT